MKKHPTLPTPLSLAAASQRFPSHGHSAFTAGVLVLLGGMRALTLAFKILQMRFTVFPCLPDLDGFGAFCSRFWNPL